MIMIPFAEVYYGAGEPEKGNEIILKLLDYYADDLRYYNTVKPSFVEKYYSDSITRIMRILREIAQVARTNGQPELSAKATELMESYK